MMIITTLAAMTAGYLLGVMFGTPSAISARKLLSKLCGSLAPRFSRSYQDSDDGQSTGGGFYIALVLIITIIPTAALLFVLYWKLPVAALVVDSLLCWSVMDIKEQSRLSQAAARTVRSGNTAKAAKFASKLGRVDCSNYETEDLIRASVQGTADRTVDSAAAPLFYMVLLSGLGGLIFRAADAAASADVSEAFLAPSKKLRDLLCFIPGKLAMIILLVDAFFLKMNVHAAERVMRQDRKKCSRKAFGGCRAVLAGLLGISLLPEEFYVAQFSRSFTIGEQVSDIDAGDITIANQLMLGTAFIIMALFFMIKLTVGVFVG